ncbi:hypothetical protein I6L25_12965 [Acinetobacter nosocomialis]|uniref:hypothetical protein n=1 Tax=Acinetobacter nosocomialis TaxID=106654 RepID=UPI0002D0974E|nr:hypothetical protein [Acinetobacter nosocomialis]ENU46300.1 hypothetical protein F984_02339 [Acinetobacter nosocomialis NIPH 2119]QXC11307.1 hypothetical protein I6L25_12965 [Acinetobacter nosocomialis]
MKAYKFIQNFSFEKTKEIVENAPDQALKVVYRNEYLCIYYKKSKNGNVMSYNEYLKKFTYQRTSNRVWDAPEMSDLLELKQFVESIVIITKLGGISEAKEDLLICNLSDCGETVYLKESGEIFRCSTERLKQAISDYEDVYINDVKHQIQYGLPVLSNSKAGCVFFPYTSMTIGIDLAEGPDWSTSIPGDNS